MRVTESHLVTQVRNRGAILRAGLRENGEFTAIDSERIGRPLWKLSILLRGGKGKGWTTVQAFNAISYYYFERLVWKRFGQAICAGEFDVVHRLTPLSPAVPSTLARKCARADVPFVIGPLNGGLPWPNGFGEARRREREWLVPLRSAYRLLPGYRSTRRFAAAIIAGSKEAQSQIADRYQNKVIYIPENGIDVKRFPAQARTCVPKLPLRGVFVGRLVPCKGVDMLIEAARPLLETGSFKLTIVGDGPEAERLSSLCSEVAGRDLVRFTGSVPHQEVCEHLVEADVLVFPSIYEFGGVVVLEAMSLGTVPIVVKYGGPGELVTPSTGYLINIGARDAIVADLRATLKTICQNSDVLREKQKRAVKRARNLFSWDSKARQILTVYDWALGRRERPSFDSVFFELPTMT